MSARYNAVIVGQTGVGKSTLINYLYGKKVAVAGVGKPVTKNGFHPINFEINGLPVCLFDSWGLEVGSYEQWMQELDKEFQQRGVNESADKWFHSVFYCIQAGGARIQECDITIIKKFIAENYKVSVILTKCDQVDLGVEEDLKAELQKQIYGLSVISICSEEKRTRTGITEPFGKEDVERQAFNDFFDSLIVRLPLRCKSFMQQALDNWVEESKRKILSNIRFMGIGIGGVEAEIKNSVEELQNEIQRLVNTEIKQTFEMYSIFSTHLGYLPPSKIQSKERVVTVDFEWSDVGLAAGAIFIMITLPFTIEFLGRDIIKHLIGEAGHIVNKKYLTIEAIVRYVDECEYEFKKIINSNVKEITKMLELAKLNLITQKLLS
jgi:predicted GTPase